MPTMSTTTTEQEGMLTRSMESGNLPSDTFLWMALGSIGLSLTFRIMGRDHDALFVGQWAPTFLLLGIFNRLVKTTGSQSLTSSGL